MKIGVALVPYPDIYKEARELEQLGYDSCWLFDGPVICSDVYAALALAAIHTERIRLGTAVAVARNRIAPVTAHSIATINQLAPGRVVLGFGTGNTGRRALGMAPVGLRDFRREAECIGALLRGHSARYYEDGRQSMVRLLHPHDGFLCVDPPVPVYIGAFGPKAVALSGEIGDGLITAAPTDNALRAIVEQARAARKTSGRAEPFEVVAMLGVYVTAPGEKPDSPQAREALGPLILSLLRYTLDTFKGSAVQMKEPLRSFAAEVARLPEPRHLSLYDRYFIGVPDRFSKFVTAETIAAASVSGPPETVAAAARRLADAGADEVLLWPHGNGRQLGNFRRFAETVLTAIR